MAWTRPSGSLAHLRREVVVGGTNWKFESVAWSRSEQRAGPVRCRAFALAGHGGEKIDGYVMGERKRGKVRQVWGARDELDDPRWSETCVCLVPCGVCEEQGSGESIALVARLVV